MISNSIGTLSEKSIHSVLKNYFEPDEQYQEVKVGSYIADIKRGNEIIEIQTKNFKNLIGKIDYYLKNGFDIKIVYPIIENKVINWLDPCSHKLIETRKSSYKGVLQDSLSEVYWIIDYIIKEQLELDIVFIDAVEFKLLDGYGRNEKLKATKVDKVPTKINKVVQIKSKNDLKKFIPSTVPMEFTSKDFIKHSRCNRKWASSGLKLLRDNGVVTVVRKEGNAYIYSVNT